MLLGFPTCKTCRKRPIGFFLSSLCPLCFLLIFCSSSNLRNYTTVRESEHPSLSLDFRGDALHFPLLNLMLVYLSHMTFILLRYVPSILSFFRTF